MIKEKYHNRRLNICRITSEFPPPWEGLGPGPYELSTAQTKAGNDLIVITKHTAGCEGIDKKAPFKIYRIKAKRNLVFSFFATIKFMYLHLKKRFDIVHNHGASAIILLIVNKLLKLIPIVSSVHIVRKAQYDAIRKIDFKEICKFIDLDKLTMPELNKVELLQEKLYLKLSNVLTVVNESLKNDIIHKYGLKRNIDVIYNGVNHKFLTETPQDNQLNERFSNDDKYKILFIGVLNSRKGELDLIRAMRRVVDRSNNSKLVIIGDGPTKKLAMCLVTKLKLEKNISFISNVQYSDIQNYYKASDLFVLPSYSEGLPKVLLEAMACGTPVVVSDIPAHRNCVKNNITGYVFKLGDVNDLALTIEKALQNTSKSKTLASAAKLLVEKQYTWIEVSKRLDNTYKLLLCKDLD